MKSKFFIDGKVLELLLELESGEESDNAYSEYLERLVLVVKNTISSYLAAKGIDEAQKATILSKFDADLGGASDEEVDQMSIDTVVKEKLSDPELSQKLEEMIDQYNGFIYKSYAPKLSQEKIDMLNEYLAEIEEANQVSKDLLESIIGIADKAGEKSASVSAESSSADKTSGINLTSVT